MKSKPVILTISHQKKGHGTFPRHERMALALKRRGFDVIWISPRGYKNKKFTNLNLAINFIPDFLFISMYLKLFITCLLNFKVIKRAEYILAVREYDAISLFFNPFLKKSKKIFFSRGDVISILKVNLPDRTFFLKYKDKLIILFYPILQKIIYKKSDLMLFQAKFLKNIFKKRVNCGSQKIKILPNNCINKLQKKRKSAKLDKRIILGFAAPMYWSCKGLETIHRTYEELVKTNILFSLEIAGRGPQELQLINNLNKTSNKQYKWNGWINNIDNFFEKIDILIVPSLYDSSPNLIFEALQKKKIIFASNISAHKEILGNNELLFSKNNLKILIKRIMRVKTSRAYKKKLENKIFQLKKNHTFDWEKKFSEFVKKC